ncbi:hypothetical protein NQ315_007825 [Exocentrus adspersus]|uniref:MoaB/Mog domain-containing protein n=1 Tax=Exocentrus adspersus TaxID=1586481 RepID=A0AAV8W9R9_9CUCU|nr:hypothetical protein NQ315_007825 [Exocentrus adspersus]
MEALSFGILTVSDTCFRKQKADTAGPRLQSEIEKHFPHCKFFKKTVPDEIEEIKAALDSWIKFFECNVVFTVGGTGFSPRDVTPEATKAIIEKEAPGLAYTMVSKSLAVTPMAMLSRAVCGIRGKTLVVNLPGSAKAAVECFGFILDSIPHAVALLTEHQELVQSAHSKMQEVKAPAADSTKSKVKLDCAANRNRTSPYPMLEVDEALEKVLRECRPTLESEEVDFDKAMNRILAEDVYAEEPVPPFRASIKDGYAVRAADGVGEKFVRRVTAAGDTPCQEELKEGEVIRISTGAAIPAGADAVVQVEDTTLVEKSQDGAEELKIQINVEPKAGQDIREIGSDISAGELVLQMYNRVTPAYVGVLAMLGKTRVKVFKRASIGILSTGNELKAPNEDLKPGQIRDSNKVTLINLLKKYSYESNDCGVARDDPDSVKTVLEKALSSNDVVITTGGVSMGEYDIVKQVLEKDFGAIIHFARINMKPGKPTTFATLAYKGCHKIFFGLPGNPVSCCVTSLLFVIPVLKYMERSKIYEFPVSSVRIPILKNNDIRPEYHRVAVKVETDGELVGKSTGNQISSRLNSLADANGLAIVTNTTNKLHPYTYDKYKVILFDDLL